MLIDQFEGSGLGVVEGEAVGVEKDSHELAHEEIGFVVGGAALQVDGPPAAVAADGGAGFRGGHFSGEVFDEHAADGLEDKRPGTDGEAGASGGKGTFSPGAGGGVGDGGGGKFAEILEEEDDGDERVAGGEREKTLNPGSKTHAVIIE